MAVPKWMGDLVPPETFSVTFLGDVAQCMLMAKMKRTGDQSSTAMRAGTACHDVFAHIETVAQLTGRSQITPDECEELALRVLGNPVDPVTLAPAQFKDVITQARTFGATHVFPVDADVWDIEHPFKLDIIDRERQTVYKLTGKIDERAVWGTHCRTRDWKSGAGLPSKQEVKRWHTQLPLYGLASWLENPSLETFDSEEFYTAHGVARPYDTMTRNDMMGWLYDYAVSTCRSVVKAWEKQQFKPTSGAWCNSKCPATHLCPLPDHAKGEGGIVIATKADYVAQIEAATVEAARADRRKAAAKQWLQQQTFTHVKMPSGRWHGLNRVEKSNGDVEQHLR